VSITDCKNSRDSAQRPKNSHKSKFAMQYSMGREIGGAREPATDHFGTH